MTDPTLTITIDRTSLSLSPLVLSGSADSNALGIVSYQAPPRLALVTYAPDSINITGSEALAAKLQHANLNFDWMCDTTDDETDMQAAYVEVAAALGQFSYLVTTQVSGAPAEVWSADMGSVTPPQRTYVDMVHPDALVIAVTIPVYPIPGS